MVRRQNQRWAEAEVSPVDHSGAWSVRKTMQIHQFREG